MPRFNALVVDPDPDCRAALKEILHHEQLYGEQVYRGVYLTASFIEAITKMSDGDPIDVIFVSNRFPLPDIQSFLKSTKDDGDSLGRAFVIVVPISNDMKTAVAQGLASGADGFLVLPCSVSDLREITQIAQRIKAEARDRLLKVALNLLIQTMVDEIELRVADYYETGEPLGYERKFRAAAAALLQNDEEGLRVYYEALMEIMAEIPPTARNAQGPKSKRVRRKLRAKRIENQLDSLGSPRSEKAPRRISSRTT